MKLLGFTTPLLYAAATYGFFLWLDKKASGISSLLKRSALGSIFSTLVISHTKSDNNVEP
jgi:hypothetical protein